MIRTLMNFVFKNGLVCFCFCFLMCLILIHFVTSEILKKKKEATTKTIVFNIYYYFHKTFLREEGLSISNETVRKTFFNIYKTDFNYSALNYFSKLYFPIISSFLLWSSHTFFSKNFYRFISEFPRTLKSACLGNSLH